MADVIVVLIPAVTPRTHPDRLVNASAAEKRAATMMAIEMPP